MALVKLPSGLMYLNFYQVVLYDKVNAVNISIRKLLRLSKCPRVIKYSVELVMSICSTVFLFDEYRLAV